MNFRTTYNVGIDVAQPYVTPHYSNHNTTTISTRYTLDMQSDIKRNLTYNPEDGKSRERI